jgi:hypothetical protein
MHKLVEVEEAKALMTEALDWSIWKWLFEKGRVRQTADLGTDALEKAEKKVKAGWSAELRTAYREVGREAANHVDPAIAAAAKRVKDADDEAEEARLDAEATFDEAERRLSAGMARDGALKAIQAFELRETAIRKAEFAARLGDRQ